jgi:carbon storage regulator
MLILSRKPGERIVIGDNIHVTVLAIRGNQVRLGFSAPDNVTIFREELTVHGNGAEHQELCSSAAGDAPVDY